MSVKIILGYLKFLHRVFQHYHIAWQQADLKQDLKHRFEQALKTQSADLIDVEDYLILIQYAQQHFQRPIALVLAEHATLQDMGLLGYLASTSLDLQQAMQLFGQYYSLLYQQTNSEDLFIEHQHDHIVIYWHAPYPEWQQFYELNLALIYKITESIVENELVPPHYVGLGYSSQFQQYHYEKFFSTHIKVIPQRYVITFPVQNLQARSIAADLELNQVLSVQAKNSMHHAKEGLNSTETFAHKIKLLIEQGIQSEATESLQFYVAKQLHCSERTLQRQLKQHQLNFQTLLDDYRFEKAKMYLKKGKEFSEIAELLHYADQSAFGRAFKRWSGQTPKQYLEKIKN